MEWLAGVLKKRTRDGLRRFEMTGKTIELAKVNDKSLVLCEKPSGNTEFVVCTAYDSTKPVDRKSVV